MKTIIIGRGNLSTALLNALGPNSSVLLSSAEIVRTPLLLIEQINASDKSNIVLNCFQKSSELFITNSKTIVNNSLTNLAIILDILTGNTKKIKKIIYSSSSAVYGANSNEHCNERMLASPINMHGALKFACEQLISFYCNKYNIEYTITRIFNMFGGQYDAFSMISRLIEAFHSKQGITLINKGQAIRDYIHVDDVAWAYEKLLRITDIPILNIASGQGISTSALITALENRGIFLHIDYADKIDEICVSVADVKLAETHLEPPHYMSCFSYLEQQLPCEESLC